MPGGQACVSPCGLEPQNICDKVRACITNEVVILMHYEQDYSRTQIHFLTPAPEWLHWLGEMGRPGCILDLGAGGGRNSVYLQRAFRNAFIAALDVSYLRCALSRRNTGVAVICGDAMRLPFPDEVFDLILTTQVIEHVPDDRAFVKEATRVLKRGGRMLVSSVLRLPRGWHFYRRHGQWVLDPTHVREYKSQDEYVALFDHDLRIMLSAVEPVRFSPAHFVYRLLARGGLVKSPDAEFFSKTALAASLERWGLRIHGYRTITAIAQKV